MTSDRADRHLPYWMIWAPGVALAATAGAVNVVVVLAGGPPVTHVTGSLTRLAADQDAARGVHGLAVLGLIGSFAGGAMLCGLIIPAQRLRIGRRYGLAMVIEAALLALAAAVSSHSPLAMAMLAAFAAGLQNALVTSYGGQIVRTTHVTGIVTDLGFLFGHMLRGERVEAWKLALLAGLLAGFGLGGFAGYECSALMGAASLYPIAGLVGTMGAAYFAWRVMAGRRSGVSGDARE